MIQYHFYWDNTNLFAVPVGQDDPLFGKKLEVPPHWMGECNVELETRNYLNRRISIKARTRLPFDIFDVNICVVSIPSDVAAANLIRLQEALELIESTLTTDKAKVLGPLYSALVNQHFISDTLQEGAAPILHRWAELSNTESSSPDEIFVAIKL